MEEALYIFLGALITTAFTWFLDKLKQKRDDELHLQRKREEVYLEMLCFFEKTKLINEILGNQEPASFIENFTKISSSSDIYSSSQIGTIYNNLMNMMVQYITEGQRNNNLQESFIIKNKDVLVNAIRKELCIKD